MPDINDAKKPEAGKPQLTLQQMMDAAKQSKPATAPDGDGLKSTVATPPPESNPAITSDGCIATDETGGKTFIGRPQAGSKATIRPEEVSAAKEETSAPKDATHIWIQLKDNPAKVYSIEEVDNQYDAVKKYMEDHGIRSTTNDFNVQFLTADEVNE